DLEDQRVLHLREELPFGDRRFVGVLVAGVEQTLQHHVAVGDVAVLREIDPTETAVRNAADDLVLAADEIAGGQLRCERERRAALRAEAFGATGLAGARPADRRAARGTEPLVLRHLRVGQDDRLRIGDRRRRHRRNARAEVLYAVARRDQAASGA